MNIKYRIGTLNDLSALKDLAIKAWSPFQKQLTFENWKLLNRTISDGNTFRELLDNSTCYVCVTEHDKIVGMAYLVPHGHPTEIYLKEWCYIRFVSVDPDYEGQGIGRKLTAICIDNAKKNGESVVALHTSEFMNNARHIYESLGFKILKEISPRLGKRYWLYLLNL